MFIDLGHLSQTPSKKNLGKNMDNLQSYLQCYKEIGNGAK